MADPQSVAQTLHASDGVPLALSHWPAAGADVRRGTIVLVHGLGEHVGRYRNVVTHLTSRGWEVIGYDQRGHGGSGGRRGAIPHDGALLADLDVVVQHATRSAPPILLGHSLGGLVAALFVARALRPVRGLVLSSPALAVDLSLAQRIQLRVGRRLVPDLAVRNQLAVDRISHDPAVVRAYRDDPLVHDRITPRLAAMTVAGGMEVIAAAPRWRTPTLLLWAGADHLVAPRGSEAFAAAAPASVVRARRFDAMYHEILNEPDAAVVLATIDTWLDGFPGEP